MSPVDLAEFETKVSEIKTSEDLKAAIKWLMDNGYGELEARQWIQFQMSANAGQEAPL